MKKFKFSLATVLSYKQQVLDALQAEHGAILADIKNQESRISELQQQYENLALDYRTRCAEGLEILEVLNYQAQLRAREQGIEDEKSKLQALKKEEEHKRAEVVQAKQDTSSLEKLQEKKYSDYNHALAKSEEQYIEEFVSSRWNSSQ